jgi:hypothetical protein
MDQVLRSDWDWMLCRCVVGFWVYIEGYHLGVARNWVVRLRGGLGWIGSRATPGLSCCAYVLGENA